jgi:membrane-bound lytic murein transglycosylase D
VTSRRSFGFASRNFYACFLAALEVEKNAAQLFGPIAWSKPLEQSEIVLPTSIKYQDLLAWFDGDEIKAQVFNPHLNSQVRKLGRTIPAKTLIHFPKDQYNTVIADLGKVRVQRVNSERTIAEEKTYKVKNGLKDAKTKK